MLMPIISATNSLRPVSGQRGTMTMGDGSAEFSFLARERLGPCSPQLFQSTQDIKDDPKPGMVAHTCSPSPQEAEVDRSL